MNELDLYNMIKTTINDMAKEKKYDSLTLNTLKRKLEKEFNCYFIKLGEDLTDQFNKEKGCYIV